MTQIPDCTQHSEGAFKIEINFFVERSIFVLGQQSLQGKADFAQVCGVALTLAQSDAE